MDAMATKRVRKTVSLWPLIILNTLEFRVALTADYNFMAYTGFNYAYFDVGMHSCRYSRSCAYPSPHSNTIMEYSCQGQYSCYNNEGKPHLKTCIP